MSTKARRKAAKAWEQRFRASGSRFVSVRLSPRAAQALDELVSVHGGSARTVIEGLLLGTLAVPRDAVACAMRAHGFSEAEARDWVERGGERLTA